MAAEDEDAVRVTLTRSTRRVCTMTAVDRLVLLAERVRLREPARSRRRLENGRSLASVRVGRGRVAVAFGVVKRWPAVPF